MVLDGDLHVGERLVGQVGLGDRDLRLAAAVGAGVVDQVGDDACQPATVAADHARSARSVDRDRACRAGADGDGVADELGDEQLLEVQADRAGVEAADLEQVLDEALEPGHVARQEVERGLGPLGHLVAPGLHHLDRRRQASSTASAARG